MNKLVGPELGGLAAAESTKFDFNAFVPSGLAETVTVPDAHLLFSGDYARSGRDLVISDQTHRYVLHDYFSHEKRPTLVSPEGAPLDPRFIDAITGYTKYAQAGTSAASGDKVVGHVVTMTGSASIIRNGVAIVVNTGDAIYRNDVLQTGSNSALGMVLDDGSAFNQLTAKSSSWSHDTIRAVQARLKSAGYYSGLVDGKGGAALAPALKQWRLLGPP